MLLEIWQHCATVESSIRIDRIGSSRTSDKEAMMHIPVSADDSKGKSPSVAVAKASLLSSFRTGFMKEARNFEAIIAFQQ
jgi:hypothetical protein